MNWYKKSFSRGITLPERYEEGDIPASADHKQDPKSLVVSVPELGGQRDSLSKTREDQGRYQTKGTLPGENPLMDQDPPTGEGANGEQFVDDEDKIPPGSKAGDNIDLGPHNMQETSLYNRVKRQTKLRGLKV